MSILVLGLVLFINSFCPGMNCAFSLYYEYLIKFREVKWSLVILINGNFKLITVLIILYISISCKNFFSGHVKYH